MSHPQKKEKERRKITHKDEVENSVENWHLEDKTNSESRTSVGSEISSRNLSISCMLNSPSYFNTGFALSFRLNTTTDGFPEGTSNLKYKSSILQIIHETTFVRINSGQRFWIRDRGQILILINFSSKLIIFYSSWL